MNPKSFWRYIIELIIVIAGVTIAFWLNTRAESAKEHRTLTNYYTEIRADLSEDRKLLERIIRLNESKMKDMIAGIGQYRKGTLNRDSIFFYSQKIGAYNFFDPKDITYRSMINSGDFKLIENLVVKRKLIGLYNLYQGIEELEKNHLQALDQNFFPKYVYMVDYISGELLAPIEKDILVKNYFAFTANELSVHSSHYMAALKRNKELDSLIANEL